MDEANKGILDLLDAGAFSVATAKKLIANNLDLVGEYDGNRYEALDSMTYTHCGSCLKKYAPDEKFIEHGAAEDCITSKDKLGWDWWFDAMDDKEFAADSLCMDCFQKIFKDVLSKEIQERIVKGATKTIEDVPRRPRFF